MSEVKYFVNQDSIVRKIWGKADTILFIFAGAAAEFALNKAVDWLYFTGKLPADPLRRLFSTVEYSRQIIFSSEENAFKAIDRINMIHKGVENSRGSQIPDWAYRDVLFLLIDLSIRSYELLEHKLSETEKEETFKVFNNVGMRMHLAGLPANYKQYLRMRQEHLQQDLISSDFTIDLYHQYKKHLGTPRYRVLKQAQLLVTPKAVHERLNLGRLPWLQLVIWGYKFLRLIKVEAFLRNALLPTTHKAQIINMDNPYRSSSSFSS
ncbi:oxygenase MpaB family protein [Mucilaginibacter flavus]|uniref:oxygenase MpaB family protein n=1 Tax=Mucilaginibacter flavus TaxID=931504 RepID=UPI0025B2D3AF|nr:oxygenase MpaB family protein [Mucilaginibacter flavus]MDN3583222.1 oxygenase MpaB family protein [Mucilaginibacter flavus]